jgi:hypothetical protein
MSLWNQEAIVIAIATATAIVTVIAITILMPMTRNLICFRAALFNINQGTSSHKSK